MTTLSLPIWDFLFVLTFGISVILSYFGPNLIPFKLWAYINLCEFWESHSSNIDQTHTV